MATTREAPPGSRGHRGSFTGSEDELRRIEQDAHEEPTTTSQEPARPGGRGSTLALWLWAAAFLFVVAFFFYALGLGG